MTCGCGHVRARHGDSRNITAIDLKSAAKAAGITVDQAVLNIQASLPKLSGVERAAKSLDVACRLVKARGERRYTLGLAYPANRPDKGTAADGFRDFVSERVLEDSAWSYLRKGAAVGLRHDDGTEGHGTVVESYIWRGPDWHLGDTVIKAGDWLVGVVWDEDTWPLIKSGRLNGFSPQGSASRRVPSIESLAKLRSA